MSLNKREILWKLFGIKFIYSEKATKFCEIFNSLLSYVVPVKSKVKILQNFVTFSEYMNFKKYSPDWQINKRLQLQKQPKVDKFLWSSFYVDFDSDVPLKNFRPFILSMAIRVVEFSNGGHKIRKIFA